MANRWVANGSSFITAATLGNILVQTSVRVKTYNVYWAGLTGYWFSQAGATSSTREFGVYILSSQLYIYLGGSTTSLGTVESLFGSTTIAAEFLQLDINPTTGAYTLSTEAGVISSGTVNLNVGRVDGMLFRIGARNSSDDTGTGGTYRPLADDKFGDTEVYIGGVLVRNYIMPSGDVVTVPDIENSLDATLQNPTGGGADWEILSDINAPTLPAPILAIDKTTLKTFTTLVGAYTAETPTTIEYRVMRGVAEIITWTAVDSFAGGAYSMTPAISPNDGLTIEVRVDGGTAYAGAEFDVGLVFGLVGSSSSERMTVNSTGLLTGVFHIKQRTTNAWTRYDTETIAGEAIVNLANEIDAATGWPVGCYMYAQGGTRVTNHWVPGSGSAYNNFANNDDGGNMTLIIDQCGWNDAANDVTVTQSDVELVWNGFRTDIRNVPVLTGLAQRYQPGTKDALFIALWQAQQAAIDNLADVYPFYRLHLEIVDGIHLTQADSNIVGKMMATVALNVLGQAAYRVGPSVASFYIEGTTVTVSLGRANTNYTAVAPASALAGFRLLDDGTPAAVSSSSATASAITLNLSAPPAGVPTLEFVGWDSNAAGDGVAAFASYPEVNSVVPMPVTPLFTAISASAPPSPGGGVRFPAGIKSVNGLRTANGIRA